MSTTSDMNMIQHGRLRLPSLRTQFPRASLHSLFSSCAAHDCSTIPSAMKPYPQPQALIIRTSPDTPPLSPHNISCPVVGLPGNPLTTTLPSPCPSNDSTRTLSTASHRSYRSVSPTSPCARSFSSATTRNTRMPRQHGLRLRWEMEEQMDEERSIFGGQFLGLLEPRSNLVDDPAFSMGSLGGLVQPC